MEAGRDGERQGSMINETENFLPDYGDDYERERLDGDDEAQEGCCFPGQCCMPGPHFRHECHTAEMIQTHEYRTKRGLP